MLTYKMRNNPVTLHRAVLTLYASGLLRSLDICPVCFTTMKMCSSVEQL